MSVHLERSYLSSRGSVAVWYAFFGAPVAWFFAMLFTYVLVPYACFTGHVWALYLIEVVAVLVSLGAGFVGYRLLMDTGAELPADHATRMDRTRIMAAIGLMFSAGFTLILIGNLASTAIVGPCIPLPREPLTPDTYIMPGHAPLLADAGAVRRSC